MTAGTPPPSTPRDLAAAFGLANLLYLDVWAELLHPFHVFFRKAPPPVLAYVAITLLVGIAAAGVFFVLRLSRRAGAAGRSAQAVFLFIWALAAFFVAHQVLLRVYSRLGWVLSDVVLRSALVILLLIAGALWYTRRYRTAYVLSLVAFPVFLVGMAQAAMHVARPRPAAQLAPNPAVPLNPLPAEAPRLVWLLFDEADFRVIFADRPPSLALPEFDRLRGESFFAANAAETAGFTYKAVPSLLTGLVAQEAAPAGFHGMSLSLAGGGKGDLRSNLIRKVRSSGHNPAVVGWYLPYCRMLDAFVFCAWEPADFRDDSGMTLSHWLVKHVQTTVYYLPFSELLGLGPLITTPQSDRLARAKHLRSYRSLLEEAQRQAVRADVDFLWVHLPIPHTPGIYDRRSGALSTESERSYLDNLALADQALGQLRSTLEAAGLWERTTLIVASDHGWKWDYWKTQAGWTEEENSVAQHMDTRVPVMIRLPGQGGTEYQPAFNSALLHDLAVALMALEITDNAGIVAWLDAHRAAVPVEPQPSGR